MMLATFSQSDGMILTMFGGMFSIVIALMMVLLRQSQRHNKELISRMRDSYEKQIYLANDRLTASMERWQDVNHLVIGSQVAQPTAEPSQRVCSSTFLKANGIHKEDLSPEPDLVFVLIPFNNRYNHIFDIIRNTCQSVGLRCLRGDEEFIRGDILPHILKTMCKASVVIANIDGRNANVFYELGLAHAMDKSTLLVSKTVEDLPIDVQSKKIIVYQHLRELSSLLKDELLRLAYIRKNEPEVNEPDEVQQTKPQVPQMEDLIRGVLLGSKYRLFFNPKVSGFAKTKIMRFGLEGKILEGRNSNEAAWRIRNNRLELVDSEGSVHSRFLYNPANRLFSQENDPESGTMRKHGISDQYMIPEE